MRNAKKLMIAVLAIVTIGAGSAFAWTSSQTGHRHYQGYTLYPFLDWSYPGTGDKISGTWDTEGQCWPRASTSCGQYHAKAKRKRQGSVIKITSSEIYKGRALDTPFVFIHTFYLFDKSGVISYTQS